MSIISFDYLIKPYVLSKKFITVYYPIVPIQLSSNYKILPDPIDCILDSGSDFNLMHANIGEVLGFDIKKGEKIVHEGIGNARLTAYIHSVTLYLEGYKFKTEVHFSYDHKIPILGRYGFFKYFKRVTFNEKKLRLELEY